MKFEMRAVQIDLARQIETVETVKKFFDVAADSGMNTIIMYLEDRIKTETYPYASDAESYTPDQIRDFVAYADTLGLELIPVVSPIGHTDRFLKHPELQHLAELRDGIAGMFTPAGAGVYHNTCPRLPETYAFFDKYIAEVAALFPSRYFHLGFDEIHDLGYCDACKGESVADLFVDPLLHYYELLKGMGKEIMMWDDMLEQQPAIAERLPRDIILCAWFYQHTDRYPTSRFNTGRSYDYLTEYERMGFRYLACPWLAASIDTLTDYAAKCHPMGMLMTNWEMSNHNYIPMLYPLVAYAGALWSGKLVPSPASLESVCEQFTDTKLGARALAAAVASLTFFGIGSPGEGASYPVPQEGEYTLYRQLPLLEEVLKKTTGDRDVLDAYLVKVHHMYAQYHLWHTGYLLHEYRAGDGALTLDELKNEIVACRAEVTSLRKEALSLWQYNRGDLACPALESQQSGMEQAVDWLEQTVAAATTSDIGRLVVRFALVEFTSACKTTLTLHYADGSEKQIARGIYKAVRDRNVYYERSFEIPASPAPVGITLTVEGYGASGFRYVSATLPDGKHYLPVAVESVAGQVEHPEFLLADDNRVSNFGEQDMLQFFVNDNSPKKTNSVKLMLKEW